MTDDDLKRKRAHYANMAAAGVSEKFGDEWKADTSNEPPLLVELFFTRTAPLRATMDELIQIRSYCASVVGKRQADLERARSLLRTAACTQNLNAVAHNTA